MCKEKAKLELWRVCEIANSIKVVRVFLADLAEGANEYLPKVEKENMLLGVVGILLSIEKKVEELPGELEEVVLGKREIS